MQGIKLEKAGYVTGGKTLISGLSLHLTERRIGIIGRNGSGKTTLLRLIAGLLAPTEGSVSVDGINPFLDRKGALARLGILFQNPDHQILFPTVEEELAFGLRQKGARQADALAAARLHLERQGRGHWAGAPVSTLSGGQKHWLCLQAILLMCPETLLLDEPFSGLDPAETARASRQLAALPQRLVTISHSPEQLVASDRVIWIEAGRLAADGPPSQVLPAFLTEMARLGDFDADADLSG